MIRVSKHGWPSAWRALRYKPYSWSWFQVNHYPGFVCVWLGALEVKLTWAR